MVKQLRGVAGVLFFLTVILFLTSGRMRFSSDEVDAAVEEYTDRAIPVLVGHSQGGRLTTVTGVPVSTSDLAAQSTLYYTPYLGSKISLYDGTNWCLYTFTERSLALSGLTSGKNYDVFLYDNSGTLTLELSAAWSSDTVRTDDLTLQNGIYVKSGAATRRYLGTLRTTSTTTTEDSKTKRFLWNYYNRLPRHLLVSDTTDSWTYTTNSFRAWNNSSANSVGFVIGINEEPTLFMFEGLLYNNSSGYGGYLGIGLDSTTVNSAQLFPGSGSYNSGESVGAAYLGWTGIGYHYLQLLEAADVGGGTSYFYGDNGTANVLSGGVGYVEG